MESQQQPTFWITGWLSNGVKVSFTVPTSGNGTDALNHALVFTNELLAGGFSTHEPGLEPGEQSYTITHIARRTQPGKDGKPATPIIDFYHDGLKYSGLKTWLNTPEQIAEFEQWAGVKLANMQVWPANSAIQRGDGGEGDKYVVTLPHSRNVVWKPNPDYTEGSKTEAKRLFERFDMTAVSNGTQSSGSDTSEPAWDATVGDKLRIAFPGVDVLTVLGVQRLGEWKQGYNAAVAKLQTANMPF